MSDASLSGRSRSNFKSSSSKTTRGSVANASRRRQRGNARKSRVSYGSRSRFNANRSSGQASKASNLHKIIIDGVDVTPLSLLPPAGGNGTDEAETKTTAATSTASSTSSGAAPVTSSLLQQRQQPQAEGGAASTLGGQSSNDGTGAPRQLSAAQLDQDVVITLTETDTMELFHMRSYVVHQESDQQRTVTAQNEAYKNLFEKRKNKDLFSVAAAQTTNLSSKNKKVQAEPPLTRDAEVTATNWDIYDSQQRKGELEEWQTAPKDQGEDGLSLTEGVKDLVTMCLATPGSLLNVDSAAEEEAARKKAQVASSGLDAGRQALQEQAANRILRSASLNDSLRLVERIIQQGYYHKKQLAYHDLSPVIRPEVNVLAMTGRDRSGSASNVDTGVEASSSSEKQAADVVGGADAATSDAATAAGDSAAAPAAGENADVDTNAASSAAASSSAAAAASASAASASAAAAAAAAAAAEIAVSSNGVSGAGKGRDQHLELQWQFQCPMTKGRNVSCMVWNPKNRNLLAVAYGSFDCMTDAVVSAAPSIPASGSQGGNAGGAVIVDENAPVLPPATPQDGMILFWSLKNPEYPERAIRLPSGVTSIDFSTLRPHILAAGLYDGTVAIFDTRLPTDKPIFESDLESGRHADTVWQVKWIVRGGDHEHQTETLVSLSTDGRVKEWSMKKGLSHVDLMTLKRVPNQTGPQWRPLNSKGEGVISRLGNGLCFSFPAVVSDTVLYYVGTEDGVIHKCSSSYNEQYLGSYHGHTGPVYKIKCHPVDPNVFLSCSADWAVKLWSADKEDDSELTFHQMDLNDVVHDVEWAPNNATIFASVTADGRIEVWDVNQSALTPAICHWVDQVVDEVALAEAQEIARLEELKKKKKKKKNADMYDYDEFGDDPGDDLTRQGQDNGETKGGKGAIKEPEVEVTMRAKKLSCVRFAEDAQIIVTGDDTGSVDVYKVFGVDLNDPVRQNKPRELALLHQAMRPEQIGASNNSTADL